MQILERSAIETGFIMMFGADVAPEGWLLCDGSVYDPALNPLLFARIGNTYGGTIAAPLLPDLTQRCIRGLDQSGAIDPGRVLGVAEDSKSAVIGTNVELETAGDHTHRFTTNTTGSHSHMAGALWSNQDYRYGRDGSPPIGINYRYDLVSTGSNPFVPLVSTVGAHTHSLLGDINFAGAHTHTIAAGFDGYSHGPHVTLNFIIKA